MSPWQCTQGCCVGTVVTRERLHSVDRSRDHVAQFGGYCATMHRYCEFRTRRKNAHGRHAPAPAAPARHGRPGPADRHASAIGFFPVVAEDACGAYTEQAQARGLACVRSFALTEMTDAIVATWAATNSRSAQLG